MNNNDDERSAETVTRIKHRSSLGRSDPYVLGPAEGDLWIDWPDGHRVAVVGTDFHGGGVYGTTDDPKAAWRLAEKETLTDCTCGCAGFVFRDGGTMDDHADWMLAHYG